MAFATFSHFALFFPGKFPGEAKSFFKNALFQNDFCLLLLLLRAEKYFWKKF